MGKVWFVTGSSRGLGREIVLAALGRGDRVAATARRPEHLDDLVATHPGALAALPLDVTDPIAVRSAVDAAMAEFGRLDVVVNNAGYADLAAFEDTTPDSFRAQIETNLFGPVHVTKAVLPILREQGGGSVIMVSSVGSRSSSPGLSAYQTAKWAISGLSGILAKEVGPLGIKVTAIEPGGMQTEWAGASMAKPEPSPPYRKIIQAAAQVHETVANTAFGDPKKIAQAILHIADMDAPPTRLLLGSDALAVARGTAQTLADRDAEYEDLTRSTDRDNITEEQRAALSLDKHTA
ncbi:short-chain dehydrogenase/reductase [Actinomadura sp. NBRC 104412]|uniref:SDR family NAD(P)-dependent oxidoreductase n=1 Tax=Actinomadura sp. NBRC 104412 TaxID=3032203 RepID=UPI0024A18139|nr:SDR family NAD(P)-dependent oxidoreductase [Actinomadura sp. NBRC 104412]GLZ09168.1 short-chain dehydrogenase/reductase [Actinomadura sp. NBRC 104412]